MTNKVIVFDLDDTLYKEIEFLKSAFREIALFLESQFRLISLYEEMFNFYYQGHDTFQEIITRYNIPVEKNVLVKIIKK